MTINSIQLNNVRQFSLLTDVIEDNEEKTGTDESIFAAEIKPEPLKTLIPGVISNNSKEEDLDISNEPSNEASITNLGEELSEIKENQGLIGKAWDGIKNLFGAKNGSNKVEELIKEAELDLNKHNEARERLEAYKEGQKMSVDILGDIVSGIASVGAAALAPVTGGASLLVAAGTGALAKTAVKASDAVISGREYELSDLGYDVITGSINGAMAPLSNAIGGAAGTGVAKVLGLEAVETCAKTAVKEAGEAGIKQAGKSFLAKLLAKQGVSYVAKEGTKGGMSLLAAKAASYGVNMAVDGALSGSTDAFARALADNRIEDMPQDILKGAVGGAAAGMFIGGSTRVIFGAASNLNKKLFNNEIPETHLTSVSENTSGKMNPLGQSNASDVGITPFRETVGVQAPYASSSKLAKIETLFADLDDDIKIIAQNNARLKQFYASLDDVSIDALTVKDIADDIIDQNFMRGLSVDFSFPIVTSENYAECYDLAAVVSKRNSYLKDSAVKQFKDITSDTDVEYLSRAKSMQSTGDKIIKHVKSGKTINSIAGANSLVADGIGTRAIFKSLDGDTAICALKNAGITDDELNTLKTIWRKSDWSGLGESESVLLDKANSVLAEAQTKSLVDKLSNAIKNNEISMTEIENYAGKGGIPYFSERQIKQLYDAWLNSADAKAGMELKIKTRFASNGDLAKELGFTKEYIDNVNNKVSKPSGYTACQCNFKYKNGALGEGQFRGLDVQDFAEYEHLPYDITQNKSTVVNMAKRLEKEGKIDVAKQLGDFESSIKKLKNTGTSYNDYYNPYLSEIYAYLRKKELGIIDIIGENSLETPSLNIPFFSTAENELLSKECLAKLSRGILYEFKNSSSAA